MGDVDAPGEGPLDLGAALAQHLLGVGVLPQVVDVPGEAALAAEQRRGVGDRAEAVGLVLAVEREVHADVVGGQVAHRRVARPRRRHHDRGAGGHAVAERAVDADVGRVAGTEVVARDDHQLGVVVVAEAFGECGHQQRTLSGAPGPQADVVGLGSAGGGDELVGVGGVRRDRQRAGVALADDLQVDERAVGRPGRRRPAGGRSRRGRRRRARGAAGCPAGSSDVVNAVASGPKHWTGVFGFLVSGVSMPIRRTRSRWPSMVTSIVSPSTTAHHRCVDVERRRSRRRWSRSRATGGGQHRDAEEHPVHVPGSIADCVAAIRCSFGTLHLR